MATEPTGKVIGTMTDDMLVRVFKPTGTGENSEVFSATIAALKEALNISPSGGITSITSTDGTVVIDETDPSAPDLSAKKIRSTDGTDIAEFVSEIDSGEGRLKAVFNNADFVNPFTVLNSSGFIRIGFFNRGNPSFVSPQADAIPDATVEASAITAVNSLLAAMRGYGLIAE